MNRKALLLLVPLCYVFLAADSCSYQTSENESKQHDQQERMSSQANAQVGMPGVTRFTERRLVRELYELRDRNISTYSYTQDMSGKLHKVCDSVGYGLPYGTQFTNPEYLAYATGQAALALPQPEPNGLFMPATAEGTWLMCTDKAGVIKPIYVEPRVIVSPFPLRAADSYMEDAH